MINYDREQDDIMIRGQKPALFEDEDEEVSKNAQNCEKGILNHVCGTSYCISNEGTHLSIPSLRKGFKPFHPVRTLIYLSLISIS